jgi:hypothetical protein
MRFAFGEVVACYEKHASDEEPYVWVQSFKKHNFDSTLKTCCSVLPIIAESLSASDTVAQQPQVRKELIVWAFGF